MGYTSRMLIQAPANSISLDDIAAEGGFIGIEPGSTAWAVVGLNEGGYNCTLMELKPLIARIREHFCLDCCELKADCQCHRERDRAAEGTGAS